MKYREEKTQYTKVMLEIERHSSVGEVLIVLGVVVDGSAVITKSEWYSPKAHKYTTLKKRADNLFEDGLRFARALDLVIDDISSRQAKVERACA
jgi:hypothetical protein